MRESHLSEHGLVPGGSTRQSVTIVWRIQGRKCYFALVKRLQKVNEQTRLSSGLSLHSGESRIHAEAESEHGPKHGYDDDFKTSWLQQTTMINRSEPIVRSLICPSQTSSNYNQFVKVWSNIWSRFKLGLFGGLWPSFWTSSIHIGSSCVCIGGPLIE